MDRFIPEEWDPLTKNHGRFFITMNFIGCGLIAFMAVVRFVHGGPQPIHAIHAVLFAALASLAPLIRKARSLGLVVRLFVGLCLIIAPIAATTLQGLTTPMLLVIVLVPQLAVLVLGVRDGILWAALWIGELLGLYWLHTVRPDLVPATPASVEDFVLAMVLATALITAYTAGYKRENQIYEAHLQEASRLQDEFIAVVSHELRTPLTSIQGALQLLDSGLLDDKETKEFQGMARENSARLLSLVDDLLDIQRLELGQLALELQPLELGRALREAVALAEPLAQQQSAALRLRSLPPRLWVQVDRRRLLQILTNLISNAIKHSPPDEEITISAARAGERVRIEVSDRGPGIPELLQDQIFEKFQQVDSSSTRRHGGAGLGLSIARSLAEAHDGALGVAPRMGGGSTFFLELPLSPVES